LDHGSTIAAATVYLSAMIPLAEDVNKLPMASLIQVSKAQLRLDRITCRKRSSRSRPVTLVARDGHEARNRSGGWCFVTQNAARLEGSHGTADKMQIGADEGHY
jgi:hypothetical protein